MYHGGGKVEKERSKLRLEPASSRKTEILDRKSYRLTTSHMWAYGQEVTGGGSISLSRARKSAFADVMIGSDE
ncbi:hypothetical protein Tco_0710008 [Tanacetum coccineum]